MHHYVIKFVNDLRQVGRFLLVLWSPQPIKLTSTIVGSGVAHYNPNFIHIGSCPDTHLKLTRIIQRPLSAVTTVNEAIDSEWNITTGLFGLISSVIVYVMSGFLTSDENKV